MTTTVRPRHLRTGQQHAALTPTSSMPADETDITRVTEQLGRVPRGDFDVVVRDDDADPMVVRNEPLLDDGTPMPTRYYLVSPSLVRDVSRLEAAGGAVAPQRCPGFRRRDRAPRLGRRRLLRLLRW